MHHLGEDLGWNWIWESYLIKYGHNGWSCDSGIFCIPEVNFPARALKLWYLKRPYGHTWYKSRVLLNFDICIFSEFFTLFLKNLGAQSWVLGVLTITWGVFIGFKFFWYMHHLDEDLGWNWKWASYLIKYTHNGWSWDLGIFDIHEVNFPARAFNLDIYRNRMRPHDINPRFCWISIFVFFPNFFMIFLMNLGARSWVFGVRTSTLIVFSGF